MLASFAGLALARNWEILSTPKCDDATTAVAEI